MPLIDCNQGYRLNGRGDQIPLCLVECTICKERRIVTKYSVYKNVGLDVCFKCNTKKNVELAKK